MNRYKDILTIKKDHLEEEKNISVDERVDNLIKLKTIRKKHRIRSTPAKRAHTSTSQVLVFFLFFIHFITPQEWLPSLL